MKRRFQMMAEDADARIEIDVKIKNKNLTRDEMDTDTRRLHEGVLHAMRRFPQYTRFFASQIKTKNL